LYTGIEDKKLALQVVIEEVLRRKGKTYKSFIRNPGRII